jgi:hypothetical protein
MPQGKVLTKALPGPSGPLAPAMPASSYGPQMEAIEAMLNAPSAPMFTPEQITERKRQNDLHYQLGLLGQMSGDETLQGVGGQIFKHALAQRQPQMSERGSLDPLTGQWSYNPEYKREQLQGRYEKLQNLASTEKIQTAAREDAQTFREQQAELNRIAQQGQREAAAGAAADRRAEAQTTRAFTQEGKLRGEFDTMTKGLRAEMDEVGKLKTVIGGYEGRTMDPAAQSSVVILLNKFQDPGSVVREAEFDRIVKAQGLENQASMLKDRIVNGHILSPAMIQQIHYLSSLYEKAASTKIIKHATNYSTLARRGGLDPSNVIIDPQWQPSPSAPGAPQSQGGKKAVRVNF